MNRYWIDRKNPGADDWRFVSECSETMTLPEMALQAIDILQATSSAFVRVRVQQDGKSPDTVEVITSKHLEQQRARWQRKYERERKATEKQAGGVTGGTT
jgi:hypothetical protein